MKKVLLMLALVAATSMVALAHGDDKCKDSKKTAGCCSKDAKKEASTTAAKSCCSKDGAKTAALSKEAKAEKATAATKETAPKK